MTQSHRSNEARLVQGTPVMIVKLRPNGDEAIRYPGTAIGSPPGWVAARAPWRQGRIDLGYLIFEPDDIFLEYFALERPFNIFAIFREDGSHKGWYCNVTHPTWVEGETIYWHDLFVDVVSYPDGRVLVLDEDELLSSDLRTTEPETHQMILMARDDLLQMIADRQYPFDQVGSSENS